MDYSLYIAQLLQRFPFLCLIIHAMIQRGWDPLLVGGSVRDHVRGVPLDSIQDHDIEVHGCLFEDLQQLLACYGVVRLVGKAFGVLKLDSLPIDWSVPRMDKEGRKPEVVFDVSLNYQQACARRDLTINAMCISFKNGNLIDPYSGFDDLHAKKARAPHNDLFMQDPLRLLRVARFVSCFDLTVDPSLEAVCRTMSCAEISSERIGYELKKLLLCSAVPSRGLRWLHKIEKLACFSSELAQCANVVQSPHWHPEGDVLEHSFQTVDAAAKIASGYEEEEKKIILLYAALFHDIGKKETTVIGHDRISSHGHAKVGAQKIKSILARLHLPSGIIKSIHLLILYHMHLGQFLRTNAPLASYKWLAYNMKGAASLRLLLDLMLADLRGRNPKKEVPLADDMQEVKLLKIIIQSCGILDQPEPPLIKASDIIDTVAAHHLADILSKAYTIQIEQNISLHAELKAYVIDHIVPLYQ